MYNTGGHTSAETEQGVGTTTVAAYYKPKPGVEALKY